MCALELPRGWWHMSSPGQKSCLDPVESAQNSSAVKAESKAQGFHLLWRVSAARALSLAYRAAETKILTCTLASTLLGL